MTIEECIRCGNKNNLKRIINKDNPSLWFIVCKPCIAMFEKERGKPYKFEREEHNCSIALGTKRCMICGQEFDIQVGPCGKITVWNKKSQI